MRFEGDTRGQSVLIGSILLFAILIIAFSTYQAFVIPSQNAEVEFTHSQQIESEFSEFRSNVVNAIESSDERSTSFTLGTQYPSRLIALNPPAAAGTLSTTEPGDVSLDGVDIQEVCGVDDATSRSLVYEPQYNEYQSAQSTVYEHTFVGTTFRDGQSFPQSQRMVREDGVYLTLLTGSVSESRSGSVGVDINATHRSDSVEEVTSVTIPSQFDNETWENQILAGQGNVNSVEDAGDGRIEIILSEALSVSCAVVGLDSDPEFTPPEPESGSGNGVIGGNASLFDTQWDESSLVEVKPGGSATLTMEATERGVTPRRPIDNATVDFAEEGEGSADIFDSINPQGDVTDSNGNQDLALEIANGTIENQSQIYTTAGDDSDVLTLSVVGFKVDIESTNSPVTEGETLEVIADITNTGSVSETQTIRLEIGGEEIQESVTLDGGTSEQVTFTWQTESGDAGEYTAIVSSEDDSDTVEVTVEGATEQDADQIVLSDSGTSGGDGQATISFGLENTGDSDIDIVEISVDDTDTGALWVEREGGNTFEGAGGFFSGRIDIGAESETLDETATMSAGAVEEFDLGSFRDGTGGGGRVNMNNQVTTITLTFGDGSSTEYVLDTN